MLADSADEYESTGSSGSDSDRPNRWHGPPSTWQDMNRGEIDALTALNEIKNRDLSVHLYNTFALKHRHRNPGDGSAPAPGKDINAATGETVQHDEWTPQRSWTAWPMRGDRVPQDDFMRRDQDGIEEASTIRQPTRDMPSEPLEDAVGAAILRFAKEKFGNRPWEEAHSGPEFDASADETEDEDEDEEISEPGSVSDAQGMASRSSRSRSRSHKRSMRRESDIASREKKNEQVGSDSDNSSQEQGPTLSLYDQELEPAVSTDDQLAYDLMRPTIRSILGKLDAALMVLHRSRDAAVSYISDSSSDSEQEHPDQGRRSQSSATGPPAKKRRGRPPKAGHALRTRTPPPPAGANEDVRQGPSQGLDRGSEADVEGRTPKKIGRPRKIYPRLEGETDRDWAIRVARLRKEPIPFFKDVLDSDDPRSSASEAQPYKSRVPKRMLSKPRKSYPKDPDQDMKQTRKNTTRLGLRDWRDVLGAAALAGFSQGALDRAARRCTDLFGGSLELHTLAEHSHEQGSQDKRVQYHPGMVPDLAAGLTDEERSSEDETHSQAARYVRASSVISASSNPRGRSRSRSHSRSRASTRSRSRSVSVANSHFCNVRGCSRGIDGFSRRSNMLRHLKLVHDMNEDEVPAEVDSEDEMHGAVHVDGFLKPIKTRKGWRGDTIRRAERGSSKKAYPGRYKKRKDLNETDTEYEDRDIIMGES